MSTEPTSLAGERDGRDMSRREVGDAASIGARGTTGDSSRDEREAFEENVNLVCDLAYVAARESADYWASGDPFDGRKCWVDSDSYKALRSAVERLLQAPKSTEPQFVALRAKGVLDADDNLDCWDTPPFDLAELHVKRLNEKDSRACWRVAQLYVLAPSDPLPTAPASRACSHLQKPDEQEGQSDRALRTQAAKSAEPAWQPIDTAPKDGTLILLGRPEHTDEREALTIPGRWHKGYEDSVDDMGHDDGFLDVDFQVFSCPRSFGAETYQTAGYQPTHWMPLPQPPSPGN